MRLTLVRDDKKVKRVSVDMSVAEFSVFTNAMIRLRDDESANEVDRKYADRMLKEGVYREGSINEDN